MQSNPVPYARTLFGLLVIRLALATTLIAAGIVTASANTAPAATIEVYKLYEDAMSRASAGDYPGAIIQLKNVLQRDPEHLPGRVSLGKFLIRQGRAASAEKELQTALHLGAEAREVIPILGNALLMQRKYQGILDAIDAIGATKADTFEVLLVRGRAHYELGQYDLAETYFSRAADKARGHPHALVGLGLVERSRGRLDNSLQYLSEAVALAPDDPESLYQKGETLRWLGQSDAALVAYDRALMLNPNLLRVRLARALEYLTQGRLEDAREDARYVRAANPRDLLAAFVEWRALSGLDQSAEADVALTDLAQGLAAISDNALMREPYLLRLAAWLSFARGDLARCERYVVQYTKLNPRDPNMQVLLGRVKLLLNDADAAIGTLYPLAKQYPQNATISTLLGQAYFKIGNYGEASAELTRAAQHNPHDGAVTAQLALSRIGTGHWDDAIQQLEAAVDSDRDVIESGLLLTILQFKSGDRAAALDTIREVAAGRRNARVYNLLGILEAANGNTDAARAAFEFSQALSPASTAAEHNLAKLDLSADDITSATRRFESILERDPRSAPALLGLADTALARGNPQAAVDWLDKAASVNPDNNEIQSRRVEIYLGLGRAREAVTAASEMLQRQPENSHALETLGRAQAAAGERDKARRSFRDAVHYAGFNGPQLMGIAQHQLGVRDFKEARKTLLKATQAPSVSTAAGIALVRLDISREHYDWAQNRITKLAEDNAGKVTVMLLSGELLLAQGRAAEAVAAYEQAHELAPQTASVLGLFAAMNADGRRDEAIVLLEDWVAAYPEDMKVQRTLALWYLPARQLVKARRLHESLLAIDPSDVVLLCNLARLYQIDGDPRARKLAERAVAASPEWAVALDTLGWILVTQGDVAGGLRYLRDSIARSDNPLTRYHLAQALNEQGRPAEARKELRRLLSSGATIEWMDDVQQMYDLLAATRE